MICNFLFSTGQSLVPKVGKRSDWKFEAALWRGPGEKAELLSLPIARVILVFLKQSSYTPFLSFGPAASSPVLFFPVLARRVLGVQGNHFPPGCSLKLEKWGEVWQLVLTLLLFCRLKHAPSQQLRRQWRQLGHSRYKCWWMKWQNRYKASALREPERPSPQRACNHPAPFPLRAT